MGQILVVSKVRRLTLKHFDGIPFTGEDEEDVGSILSRGREDELDISLLLEDFKFRSFLADEMTVNETVDVEGSEVDRRESSYDGDDLLSSCFDSSVVLSDDFDERRSGFDCGWSREIDGDGVFLGELAELGSTEDVSSEVGGVEFLVVTSSVSGEEIESVDRGSVRLLHHLRYDVSLIRGRERKQTNKSQCLDEISLRTSNRDQIAGIVDRREFDRAS